MSLKTIIQNEIKEALKNKQAEKLLVLRFLHAQIKDAEIEKGRQELTDEEIVKLINNQIKKLKESLVLFEKGQRDDLVQKAKGEMAVLRTFLPKQISDEELARQIEKIIAENPSTGQPGPLIGLAIKKLAGRADNQKIAQAVRQKLLQST